MPATSPQGIAGEKLKRMFSLSTTFQFEAGGSPAVAESHIYFGTVPDLQNQSAYPRPLIVLGFEDGIFHLIGGGDQNQLRQGGLLRYWIIRNTAIADPSAAELDAIEFFSNVLTQVSEMSNADDTGSPFGESHLSIVRIDNDDFGLCPEDLWTTLGKFYGISGVVIWGDEDVRRA